MTQNSEKVITFPPPYRQQRQDEGDPLDRSGNAIVAMLQEAVEETKQNYERAMDIARQLSLKLRTAEERIAHLEGDVRHYQERAARAEKWMNRIHSEIENRFFKDEPMPGGFR